METTSLLVEDVIKFHCGEEPNMDDYEDESIYDDAMGEYNAKVLDFQQNEELYQKVLKEYIASCY